MSYYNAFLKTMGNTGGGDTPTPPTPPTPVGYTEPFYVKNSSTSTTGKTLSITKTGNAAPTLTIEKSLDGENWVTMGTTSYPTSITASMPDNGGKLYLRCKTDAWTAATNYTYTNSIYVDGNFDIGGNIMSLVYGSDFTGTETTFPNNVTRVFEMLFYENATIFDASELILPATTLTGACYRSMFAKSSLRSAPRFTIDVTPIDHAFDQMFSNCSHISYIVCYFTNVTEGNMYAWLSGVSSNGNFIKKSGVEWSRGISGIPTNWNVIEM